MSAVIVAYLDKVDKSKATFKSEASREYPAPSQFYEGVPIIRPNITLWLDASVWAEQGRPTEIRVEVGA